MKICLIQNVVSPYRIKLFQRLAETPGVDFKLLLLSAKFKTRPQWKRDLSQLPFKVEVPFGVAYQSSPEQQYCINPFLLPRLIWERPSVVVCGGYSFATLMVWLASFISPLKYVIWTEATTHTDGGITGLRLKLRRWMAGRASAFIEAGTLARDYVKGLRPNLRDEQVFRAFNCVDNDFFSKSEVDARAFARSRGFPECFLLFVGALNERKGIPRLLEAYQLLAAGNANLGCVLVGEGPLKEEVARCKARHGLSLLFAEGWMPNEQTAKYYKSAAAFVLLSEVDHNPLVLFEALAAGLPIICSRGACNALDFIQNGVNGYIVDPENIPAIVDRIRDVLGWGEERRRACARYSDAVVSRANYVDAAAAFIAAARAALGERPPQEPADLQERPVSEANVSRP